jgi:hypothetical protein
VLFSKPIAQALGTGYGGTPVQPTQPDYGSQLYNGNSLNFYKQIAQNSQWAADLARQREEDQMVQQGATPFNDSLNTYAMQYLMQHLGLGQ